ncbi:MAG: zinc metallopeptidase [Aestuariivirga sp.]
MVILSIIGILAFLALIYGPQAWIRIVMARHAQERADFPGTGGELARHLLDEAGLKDVKVERVDGGDHYSPHEKAVRLQASNFDGKSLTAVAVAAHEVGHALQDNDGYLPLQIRQKLAAYCITIEQIGSVLLFATPFVFALTRSPAVLVAEVVVALGILFSNVVIHLFTLPTEFNASFKRALPILSRYLPRDDMPAAQSVLKAAAFTYVAGALVSLLDIARWLRVLRF